MLVSLFLFSLAQGTTSDLSAEPRLDRPLAVEARIEPLPELLARIGKTLGTPLTVERRMDALKVTVFTPARPARLTLENLASVFDAEWIPVKEGGYRLAETAEARRRRESYVALDEETLRAGAEAELTRMPKEPEFVATGEVDKDEEARERFEYEKEQLPRNRRVYAMFARLTPIERQNFWQGRFIFAVGRTEGKPDKVEVEETDGGTQTSITSYPSGLNLTLIRYQRDDGLSITIYAPANSDESGSSGSSSAGAVATDHPFRRSQLEWATDLATSKDGALDLPLKEVPTQPTRWARGMVTSSDVLWEIHRRYGIPIVAEANRKILNENYVFRDQTLRGELRRGLLARGVLRLEKGALLHRPEEFWRVRSVEPSEAVLAPFEKEATLTLDSLATLYAETPPQAFLAWPGRPPFASVHDLELAPRFAVDEDPGLTLRLWGRLAPATRERLAQGGTVALTALSGADRNAVGEAITDAVFKGGEIQIDGKPWFLSEEGEGPAPIVMGLLGLGPSHPYVLSATLKGTTVKSDSPDTDSARADSGRTDSGRTGSPERRTLTIRIVDGRGTGLRLPNAGPY